MLLEKSSVISHQASGRPEPGSERPGVAAPESFDIPVALRAEAVPHPRWDRPLEAGVRESRLLTESPWVRSLGRLDLSVTTEGWKFPAPPAEYAPPPRPPAPEGEPKPARQPVTLPQLPDGQAGAKARIRTKPTADTVLFKDRLLYLLQPPLDGLFDGRQLEVPFEPFPYQLEGIAFLMPRHAALLADEMGLGKTAQAILSLRLLFHQGVIRRGLLIYPKPLIHN